MESICTMGIIIVFSRLVAITNLHNSTSTVCYVNSFSIFIFQSSEERKVKDVPLCSSFFQSTNKSSSKVSIRRRLFLPSPPPPPLLSSLLSHVLHSSHSHGLRIRLVLTNDTSCFIINLKESIWLWIMMVLKMNPLVWVKTARHIHYFSFVGKFPEISRAAKREIFFSTEREREIWRGLPFFLPFFPLVHPWYPLISD